MAISLIKQEQQEVIRNLVKNFHRKGELLLPDDELYPKTLDNDSIEKAARKILVWVGEKPNNLHINIVSNSSSYGIDGDKRFIHISSNVTNSFVSSALTARFCVEYLLDKKNISKTPEIVELATIELGLGLLIVNAINSGQNTRAKTNRVCNVLKPSVPATILSYYSIDEYSRHFAEYLSINQLPINPVIEHTLPWSRKYLPISKTGILKDETFVHSAKQLQIVNRIKLLGIIICVSALTMIIRFVIHNQPRVLPPELQSQKESIAILDQSYTKCMDELRSKESTYSSNDIFMVRQLDAHLSRCTSIRNKHDYLVNDFNQKIESKHLL